MVDKSGVEVLYGAFNISLLAETLEHGWETSIQNVGSAISRAFMSGVLYATQSVLMYPKLGGRCPLGLKAEFVAARLSEYSMTPF